MDVFMEYLIKRKRDTKDNLIVAAIILAGTLLTIVMLAVLFILSLSLAGSNEGAAQFSSLIFGMGMLLVAGIWYGAYILINRRSVEYEYILTNSEIDVDKIFAKKGRKRVISFDFKDADIVANINDNEHNSEYRNNTEGVKLYDLTGNKANGNIYFVDISIEGEKSRVLLQPTSKMLDSIKRFNPRNVFIKEDY